ncbi:MAG: type I restriction enzyme HsdR N-terminal domain-containing protein, partial [Bacteroidota bacterium]
MKTFDTLNFPEARLKLKEKNGKTFVFDLIRKKWLQLTPEEWVRQHMINYLINNKSYPASLFSL